MLRHLVAALATVLALALAGCGDDDSGGSGKGPQLTVSAATSLKLAFESYSDSFGQARVRYSFAGSDELAAQIRSGARPDVYAAANTKLPNELYDEGLVQRPVRFAANRLVLAVPEDTEGIDSVDDLTGSDAKVVIGSAAVPIGSYTREVLARLGERTSGQILDNVRSNEPDVGGIVGKLTQGAADAGFVYVTDVAATMGELRAIELPKRLQPRVEYAAAVVKGTDHADAARAFIDGLLDGDGLANMRDAGFEPPPAG